MRADPTPTTAGDARLVGVHSGIVLDLELVATLRAVAARADVAQRVLSIVEPDAGTTMAVTGRPGR
jgi:hypothetical protein